MAIALPSQSPQDDQDSDDFAYWIDGLSDAERAELALDFLAELKQATGPVSGAVGYPSLGYFATVTFDGIDAMEAWAREHRWPKVRERLMDERAEAQWEAMQARYIA